MLKKGLALEYVFLLVVFFVVVVVGIMIVEHFYRQSEKQIDVNIGADVSYMCIQLNESLISFQDFQDLLYGFMTGQCYGFQGAIKQGLTIDDIRRIVGSIDDSAQVIYIQECKLPQINSGNVYVNFSEIPANSNLYLTRKKINNSDILICG